LAGRRIEIDLLHFLRPEKKFRNAGALTAAIAGDVRRAKAFLKRHRESN
jgi:FAD synthase